jgi:EmrB/QacA subfamily drug resistance transporter
VGDGEDDQQVRRAWTTFAAVALSNLQMSMSLSMIFVVFPSLEASFPDASSATLSWAVNIYTIVGAATLVLGAAATQRIGAKAALLGGIAVFTVAAVAAAASPTVPLLITCRVVQALGSSLIVPSGAAIVFGAFPLSHRRMAVAAWAAVGAVGAAAGPSLGGLVIDVGNWRWAFWLNLPLGVAALAVGARVLSPTPAQRGVEVPDPVGGVALFAGLGGLVLGLVQSPSWGWADARTIGCLVGGVALLALVVHRSRRHPRPLLQLDLLRHRSFRLGNLAMLVLSVSFFGFLLTSVLFLTDVWDRSIRSAGLLTAPIFAATAVMSVAAGRLGDRFGYRGTAVAGGVLWGAGTLGIAFGLSGGRDTGAWLVAIVVIGLGSGLLWGSMFAVTLGELPSDDVPAGSGMNQTLQNLGNSVGVAVAVTVLGDVAIGDVDAFPALWVASAITTAIAVVAAVAAVGTGRSPAATVVPVASTLAPADG